MKKLLLLLLCVPLIGLSQQTYVPDDNFEAFIETTYPAADNGIVNDNYVLTSGLDLFNNPPTNGHVSINNSSGPIFDVTGIEDFKLGQLTINNTFITHLNLSAANFRDLYILGVGSNQYLEEIILPNNSDTIVYFSCSYNDSLSNIVFSLDGKYHEMTIHYNFNLCEIMFKGDLVNRWGGTPYIEVTSCPNIIQLDFSSITNAPYQTTLWLPLYDGGGTISQINQVNLANNLSIYNWVMVNDFDNSFWCPNFSCIQVSSQSDSAFCAGNNAWPNVVYGTNCYNTINCNNVLSLEDSYSIKKEPFKVIDLLGREVNEKRNTLLFYIYDDGTVEKKIIIE